MRRILCFLAGFFLVQVINSQVITGEKSLQDQIFPLALVLDAAGFTGDTMEVPGVFWRPDWPLELPPDSFSARQGSFSRAEIQGDNFSLILGYGQDGRLEEFPFFLNGRFSQVSLVYRDAFEINWMNLAFEEEEEIWKLEFLEYGNDYPSLVRVEYGEVFYFISLSSGGDVIMETWFDEDGNALGAYAFSLVKNGEKSRISSARDFSNADGLMEFFYDSRDLITGITGVGGVFQVQYYLDDFPRYWERRPVMAEDAELYAGDDGGAGNFSLQWDERGLLVRITGGMGSGIEEGDGIDYRYEYILDGRGNWIERRETRMIRQMNLLVPAQGTVVKRVLEYSQSR